MNLRVVHSGESEVLVSPHLDIASDHPASTRSATDEHPTDEHPIALAVITLCDSEKREVVRELVEGAISLVEILVSERLRTLPPHVSRDDLMSAGMLALVLSAKAFDPERGASFRSFAAFRIRGALIDELRGSDWASRSVRARIREVETVRAELAATLGRGPSEAELAAALGISVRDLDAIHLDSARGAVISLQGLPGEVVHDVLPDRAAGPEELLVQREQLGYLHEAVDALPARLRTVVEAYYFQSRPMNEIAAELSVTPSRVSQLCSEATALLRDGMNSQLDPDALAPLARTGRAAATRRAYYEALAGRRTVAGRLAMSTPDGHLRRRTYGDVVRTRSRIA